LDKDYLQGISLFVSLSLQKCDRELLAKRRVHKLKKRKKVNRESRHIIKVDCVMDTKSIITSYVSHARVGAFENMYPYLYLESFFQHILLY
jgi:hypothetical protein